jgi:fermentation-respiration switch protein FrsA (DUF1100 family)
MRWIAVALAGLIVGLGLIWALQRRLIYLPDQEIPDIDTVLPGAEEVTFSTEDDLTLTAWFLPAAAGESGTVMVFNGNAGNRASRSPLGAALSRHGYSVLLVDYRGYGGNPGSPSQQGLLADARAARSYVASRHDVDAARLIYFGESLGAGVALGLASEVPPTALILRSPFVSLADIGSHHYPFLPISLLLSDRYPNDAWITEIDAPVMMIAGSEDRIVPLDQTERLFGLASPPKSLLVIEGAGHNDFALLAGTEMIDGIVEFLEGEPERPS